MDVLPLEPVMPITVTSGSRASTAEASRASAAGTSATTTAGTPTGRAASTADGPGGDRLPRVLVPVHPLADQRDEQAAGTDPARVQLHVAGHPRRRVGRVAPASRRPPPPPPRG